MPLKGQGKSRLNMHNLHLNNYICHFIEIAKYCKNVYRFIYMYNHNVNIYGANKITLINRSLIRTSSPKRMNKLPIMFLQMYKDEIYKL